MIVKTWLKYAWLGLVLLLVFGGCQDKEEYVLIETDMGNMRVLLYNSTPKHKDNFLKLVDEKFYDGLLFHRIIKGFMVQGGDPDSRDAGQGVMLGSGGPGYEIEPEIDALHYKGALAAARAPDPVNPDKLSSGSQFYIVSGRTWSDNHLNQIENQKNLQYTEEQRKIYREIGGYPPLDGEYTVFGEVVEGLEVIDRLEAAQTGQGDRPMNDIRMKITRL